jgi:hypothetical protein
MKRYFLRRFIYRRFLVFTAVLALFALQKLIIDTQNEADKARDEQLQFKSRIMRTKYNVNCKLLFEDNEHERNKSLELMQRLREEAGRDDGEIDLINESNFIFNKTECGLFRHLRGYDSHHVSDFEIDFPLAFTILAHNNVEQLERLLRTIYRSQNVYCIHVDSKSSAVMKQAVESITNCFDNVFTATRSESVFWGHFSLIRAQLNCIDDLLNLNKLDNRKNKTRFLEWKYWLNVPSTFLPLRTNLEFTRILHMYNGTSDVKMIHDPLEYYYQHETVFELDEGNVMASTGVDKTEPPFNYTILTGSNYVAASRLFVDYVVNSEQGKALIEWGKDMFIPVYFISIVIQ